MGDSSSPGHNALCFLTAFLAVSGLSSWSIVHPVQRGEGGPAWFPTPACCAGQILSAAPTPPFLLGRSQAAVTHPLCPAVDCR